MTDTSPPAAIQFLTAQWKNLVMLNYAVDPSLLLPFVPRGTVLDRWNGQALISLVAFHFIDTRVLGLPIPFHRNFEEVNLRFYVRREIGNECRRGVVFLREIVPRWWIRFIANAVYNERYVTRHMDHAIIADSGSDTVRYAYRWGTRGAMHAVSASCVGDPSAITDGSDEEFITEHYWGYTSQRNGSTLEYQVAHPRWRVWKPMDYSFTCANSALFHTPLDHYLAGTPDSVLVAEGSPVIVHRGVKLSTT